MIEPIYFNDLSYALTAHPVTGNVKTLQNIDAIKQSVKLIVTTNYYDTPYNPKFGANLIAQLFEPITPIRQYIIRKQISVALSNHEPRADIINVSVTENADESVLNITITFKPVNSFDIESVNIPLQRIR